MIGTNGRRRYLVTGGCGFIGSHLVDALLFDNHDVVVLDNLSTGSTNNLDRRAELIVGDVTDPNTVMRAFEGVAGCFHLAAIASVTRSNEDWLGTHRVNQTGTVCVLNAARAKPGMAPVRVVYASSAAVYGDCTLERITEDVPTKPLTAYGADKLGSELHARVASLVHRIPTIGLRFFNIYGPRQHRSSSYSGVISIFVDRLVAGLPVSIYGDGSQSRDFVYVADAVAYLKLAMARCDAGSHVYNVCTGVATTIRQLAALVAKEVGTVPRISFEPPRNGDILRSLGCPDRANSALGFIARHSVDAGLKTLVRNI